MILGPAGDRRFSGSGRPRGAGKPIKIEWFPRPPGPRKSTISGRPKKSCIKIPSVLLSGALKTGYLKAGFWPDCYRGGTEIGPPAGRTRPEGRFRCFPGSSSAEIPPGSPISGPEALSRSMREVPLFFLADAAPWAR